MRKEKEEEGKLPEEGARRAKRSQFQSKEGGNTDKKKKKTKKGKKHCARTLDHQR